MTIDADPGCAGRHRPQCREMVSCLTDMQNWAAQMGWWKASMNCPSASWHS